MVSTAGHSQVDDAGRRRSRTPQHQDWFDENDAAISNLLAEKNRLHKAYIDRPTDDNRAAFYLSRRLVQKRLRKMRDVWTACKTDEIQGLMFSAILTDAYRYEHPGIRVAYRTDGYLHNQRRVHFQSRVLTTTVENFCLPTTAPSMQPLKETWKVA
ncbi:hypothetical protein SprV_0401576700 [Sparganum proliferum]